MIRPPPQLPPQLTGGTGALEVVDQVGAFGPQQTRLLGAVVRVDLAA